MPAIGVNKANKQQQQASPSAFPQREQGAKSIADYTNNGTILSFKSRRQAKR
ncbi:hypothetical protein HMPREF1991_02724 [Hoylesella loescheii DSM 19665 = JCM 12249 = ATCC 15930]|uniref:Uncharacterized protein n=1 Tax=Hoylesella loescheii DSM 19665 = JCM 12249 = ATCC 15930 TaxID=1122985 RepID=A0A069QN05_HOYLO|nr:hypothetical protein HMPREF1991_02724 [Hoylesella loescheii DSM 19665 = JCM 12249 = ATCC 15930]